MPEENNNSPTQLFETEYVERLSNKESLVSNPICCIPLRVLAGSDLF